MKPGCAFVPSDQTNAALGKHLRPLCFRWGRLGRTCVPACVRKSRFNHKDPVVSPRAWEHWMHFFWGGGLRTFPCSSLVFESQQAQHEHYPYGVLFGLPALLPKLRETLPDIGSPLAEQDCESLGLLHVCMRWIKEQTCTRAPCANDSRFPSEPFRCSPITSRLQLSNSHFEIFGFGSMVL